MLKTTGHAVLFWIITFLPCLIANGQGTGDEIFDKVIDASKIRFRSGMGAFLIRHYDSSKGDPDVIATHLAGLEESLLASVGYQIKARKQLGIEADVAKLDADVKRTLESVRAELLGEGLTTEAQFFYIDGLKYRIERVKGLRNDALQPKSSNEK